MLSGGEAGGCAAHFSSNPVSNPNPNPHPNPYPTPNPTPNPNPTPRRAAHFGSELVFSLQDTVTEGQLVSTTYSLEARSSSLLTYLLT